MATKALGRLFAASAVAAIFFAAVLSSADEPDVHDLLPVIGLPRGLLPSSVKSYTVDVEGRFAVELDAPCYVKFSRLVYYEKKITGTLKYGAISDLTGIQAKKLFVWVSVTSINVEAGNGVIEFHAGIFSEKLSASEFENVRECQASAAVPPLLLETLDLPLSDQE